MQQQQDTASPRMEAQNNKDREYSSISALTDVSVENEVVYSDDVVAQEEREELIPSSHHARSTTADTLKLVDLNEVGPLETEAETCILKAIEEKEEPRGQRAPTGSSILKHVPPNVDSLLDSKNAETKTRIKASASASRRRTSIKMPRTGQGLDTELAALACAMQDVREEDADNEGIPTDGRRGVNHDDGPTQPDSLLDHAEVVFGRNIKRRRGFRHLRNTSRSNASNNTAHQLENAADPELGFMKGTDDHTPARRKRFVKRLKYTSKKSFLGEKWKFIRMYLLISIFYIILPLLGFSALFFNYGGNPAMRNRETTISYMFNFAVRHVCTFTLALATQLVVIDLIAMRTQFIVRVFGQIFTLVLIQSHGIPFVVFFWSLYSSILTTGHNEFAKHWLFWQDKLPIYTAANPDGGLTTGQTYFDVLNAALVFGIAVLVKRVVLGIYMGRRTYLRYGDQLADVLREMLLVSEVGLLAEGIEAGLSGSELGFQAASVSFPSPKEINETSIKDDEDSVTLVINVSSESNIGKSGVVDTEERSLLTGSLKRTQRIKIQKLLGDWEEPKKERKEKKKVSAHAVIQFRHALQLTDDDYPFSRAFGLADSRETCVESSQKVYSRLVSTSSNSKMLDFGTIAVLGTTETGDVDKEKMKELIRLFRPNRDGKLSMLDFVRSVDGVYKTMRLLRASVENASQIDHAFEQIINVCFYVVLFVILVAIMGFDPFSLILSLSSLVVAFAFAISSATSKAFEGILFVLLRRPFDIGDRIHVSPVDEDSNRDGSSTWFVEKVDLFSTQIRFATTNEVATCTNGSMASSRIINAARSKNPVTYVYMKFGVDVSYRKVKIFKATVEDFVKQRPRQFVGMNGFRATKVEQDKGYIEYVIVLQHRGSWQQIGPILNNKAEFSSFALEVAKKLNMRYNVPGMSVDLTIDKSSKEKLDAASKTDADDASEAGTIPTDMEEVAALFAMAKG